MAVQRLLPYLQFFGREPVTFANLVGGNESTAHGSHDVCLVARQPMFEVYRRKVSEREQAAVRAGRFLESPHSRLVVRIPSLCWDGVFGWLVQSNVIPPVGITTLAM